MKYVFNLVLVLFSISIHTQTTIVNQSFETSGDTWQIDYSTPPCTIGNDSWNYQNTLGGISPSNGNQFWGVTDLNGDCGGNGFEFINFSNIDISAYQNVELSFDFNAIELDNGDDLKYEIFLDGISQGEVLFFEGNNNLSTNGWVTQTILIPNSASQISFKILIKQNGSDYIGIDNVVLRGNLINSCSELFISEYIEGNSSGNLYRNNFIELYNASSQDIDLQNYSLTLFVNDNFESTGNIPLQGIIPAYGTFLIEDETENLGIEADISTPSSVMNFNGNDKVALLKNGEIIDLIGTIGNLDNFAENITLRRKSNVQNPNSQFEPSEWDIYGLEDVVNLNTHASNCKEPIPEIGIVGNGNEITDGSITTHSLNNTYFGSISPNDNIGISKSFTIKNVGNEILIINDINITGENSTEFVLQNNINANINPNDSIIFQINFNPNSQGIKTAEVNIQNNDDSENPFNFTIQAEGTGLSNSPIMITQYYEGTGNNRWIEVTNISNNNTQNNTYFLALFRNEDAQNPIGISPSSKRSIPALVAGEVIKFSATLNVTLPAYAIDGTEIKTGVCNFTGDDIIVISTTDDTTCWQNKIDIIGNSENWGTDKSFVRKYGCEAVSPSTGFDLNDWMVNDINEIDSAAIGFNQRIGLHYIGSSSFENSGNWNNGNPDIYRDIIINSDYNTLVHGNLEACNLTINYSYSLEIEAENFIKIKNNLTVDGVLDVFHQGSVFMINNTGTINNNGITNIHKTTTTIKKSDYTYWSSPIKTAILGDVFKDSPQNSFYTFVTQNYSDSDNDGYDDNSNAWQKTNGLMEIGKGYTAMAPNTEPFIDKQSVVFSGEINNGKIFVEINQSEDTGNNEDDWNFIGNPYPSAISIDSLFSNSANENLINGSFYFWTHNTSADQNQKYSSNDYAMYTIGTGGISAISQGQIPTGDIASGQGFFVEAKQQGLLELNNSMRIDSGNDNFFKTKKLKQEGNDNHKDKIWLNLYNNQGVYSQILIGFLQDASPEYESNYDGLRFDGNSFISFYSIVNNKKLAIQGTSPFTDDKIIKLGINSKIEEETMFNIEIDHVEGDFNNQNIYLFDKELDILHLLNQGAYTFKLDKNEIYDERFVLKFDNAVLSLNDDIKINYNNLILAKKYNQLIVSTKNNSTIASVEIYDILGRKIYHKIVNQPLYKISDQTLQGGTVYIIKVKLKSNQVLIKKFIT